MNCSWPFLCLATGLHAASERPSWFAHRLALPTIQAVSANKKSTAHRQAELQSRTDSSGTWSHRRCNQPLNSDSILRVVFGLSISFV